MELPELDQGELKTILNGSSTVRRRAAEWIDPLGHGEVKSVRLERFEAGANMLQEFLESLLELESSASPGPTFVELSAIAGTGLITSFYTVFPRLQTSLSERSDSRSTRLGNEINELLTNEGSVGKRLRHKLCHEQLVPTQKDILEFADGRRITFEEATDALRSGLKLLIALHEIALAQLQD